MRNELSNEFIIARQRGEHERALELIDKTAKLGEHLGSTWTQFQASYRRALIRSDQGEYGEALQLTADLAGQIRTSGRQDYLPYLLNVQIEIAARASDRDVARQALHQLAAMDEDVPDNIYRQASATYASVFGGASDDSPLPFWMLFSIAVGVSVVLQFISTAVRGTQNESGPIARMSALAAGTQGPKTQTRADQLGVMPEGDIFLPDVDSAQRDSTDASETTKIDSRDFASHGDGVALSEEDAEWLTSIGIGLDDLPEVEPRIPERETPRTLGQMLRRCMRTSPAVSVYSSSGEKTGTISVPERIIQHASSDRFIAISMSGRVVLAYRYARPQTQIIQQTPDGGLQAIELDEPVMAVPIAVMNTTV
ncbi:hypothetical protein CRI94_09555 [Longibacter salinarum]|uniref:Uncharacterized protein n=1 Tax=Longibacter salinarum TaxID=1850348 RepID=A0A2A8CY89_9BACT|nr:hypothetical protein [Longibacter salinarum]PEN13547.1 hypothetical protein CRI94_09555 [Longibacter salinarum]